MLGTNGQERKQKHLLFGNIGKHWLIGNAGKNGLAISKNSWLIVNVGKHWLRNKTENW